MLIVDAHEDIAWNILTFGRDYTRSALWIRAQEKETPIPSYNGNTLLGRKEWLAGRVGVIFATLFVSPIRRKMGEWDKQVYRDRREAYRLAHLQLDAYRRLADVCPQFKLIGTQDDLEEVLDSWSQPSTADPHIGLVPLMEGADPIPKPELVEEWYEEGVRIVGLAWEETAYAGGTHEPGPLTRAGIQLIEIMADLGLILDLSHIAEDAYYQAIDRYEGTVVVTHANPRRFLPTSRGLSDEMIAVLAERGGVVGVVPYNAFLKPGWRKGDSKSAVRLTDVADVIDHVCQTTGDALHVGIGSDFDGGFGVEHVPAEIDTVADLKKLSSVLEGRGYTTGQVADILGGNWLRLLKNSLPAG
jgi:membrane dipeptidase